MKTFKDYFVIFIMALVVGSGIGMALSIWFPTIIAWKFGFGWAMGWTTAEFVKELCKAGKHEKTNPS